MILTLKEIREKTGLNQRALAERVGIPTPYISEYESGIRQLDLAAMINLEKTLDSRVDWRLKLNDLQRQEVIFLISGLAKNYPLQAVLNFSQRAIASDSRTGDPLRLLRIYARAGAESAKPLLPPGIKQY